MGMKQKKNFFFEKKNSKWPTQKNDVFQNRQFSIFFASFILKSVQIFMVEWMGRNFDVFLVSRKFHAMRNITLYSVCG